MGSYKITQLSSCRLIKGLGAERYNYRV